MMSISEDALRYASLGWPVFPCRPGRKTPLTEHGYQDATTDEQTIRSWWAHWPHANLAWPTGPATADVIDVDIGATGSGWAAFNRLKRAGLLTGMLATVQTPSGGLHVYFHGSTQRCGSLPRHFIDFRADGGYVLAPPSIVNGRRYQWLTTHDALTTSGLDWNAVKTLLAPPAPSLPAPPPGSSHSITALVRAVERTPEGSRNRNKILFWAACRAVSEGHHAHLSDLIQAAVSNGLSEAEAHRTVANAHRHVTGRP